MVLFEKYNDDLTLGKKLMLGVQHTQDAAGKREQGEQIEKKRN